MKSKEEIIKDMMSLLKGMRAVDALAIVAAIRYNIENKSIVPES